MVDFIRFNISLEFEEIFSIGIEHGFFQGNKAKKLHLAPTEKSLQLFRQYGLHQKSNSLGTIAGFKQGTDTRDLLLAKEPISFIFLIYVDDPTFYQVTNIPALKENTGFYFSNLNGNVTDGKILLHPGPAVNGKDIIAFSGPAFDYGISDNQEKVSWKVSNAHGRLVMEETSQISGRPFIHVDLRDQTAGVYMLEVKGREPFRFFRLDDLRKVPLGIIEIDVTDRPKPDFRLIDSKGFYQKKFTIRFQPRSTFWKYVIMESTNAGLYENFQISDPDKKVVFSAAKEEVMRSGRKALTITSEKPIIMKENQSARFQLSMQKKSGAGMSIDLPMANPYVILPDPEGKSEIYYSEIFIYV